MRVFDEYGIIPDEAYNGLTFEATGHNHGELQQFINAVAPVAVENRKESKQYHAIVNSILDIYLGKLPESFLYKGTQYTPESYSKSLGINPDDYVEITSFTHFPFYSRGILEVPDNWAMEKFYNVPIDELIEIIDYSFQNGYTVNWDGDVSESGFQHQNGFAIVPLRQGPERGPMTDRQRLEGNTGNNGSQNSKPPVPSPGPEISISQEIRQAGYENFSTTDDHLMHLTGIVKDQNGTKYYKTKNSWGTERNSYGGYLHMSESFVRAKTIYIMVHKNGIPPQIKTKLGI
jgi:bleomycin hydrolase